MTIKANTKQPLFKKSTTKHTWLHGLYVDNAPAVFNYPVNLECLLKV